MIGRFLARTQIVVSLIIVTALSAHNQTMNVPEIRVLGLHTALSPIRVEYERRADEKLEEKSDFEYLSQLSPCS